MHQLIYITGHDQNDAKWCNSEKAHKNGDGNNDVSKQKVG